MGVLGLPLISLEVWGFSQPHVHGKVQGPHAPGGHSDGKLPGCLKGLFCGGTWSRMMEGRQQLDFSPCSCKDSLIFLKTTTLCLPTELQARRWLDEHVVSGCDMKVSICALFVWFPWVCFSCSYSPELFPIVFMLRQKTWLWSVGAPGSAGPPPPHPSKRHQLQGTCTCPPDPPVTKEPAPVTPGRHCCWDFKAAECRAHCRGISPSQASRKPAPPLPPQASAYSASGASCSTWSTTVSQGHGLPEGCT